MRSFCLTMLSYTLLFAWVIGANPFAGETSAPMDILSDYPGWFSHDFSSKESHPERIDILDALIPHWITLKEAIRAGDSGIWNPVAVNGVPGVLDLSQAALTPSFLVFLLIDEHWLGFYFAGLVKLVIAAMGGFLFLRFFIGFSGAFLGGAIFALSGFNAAWFYWPHVSTSGWIPWLLWGGAGWFLFKEKKWIFIIMFTTAMLILGGFPSVAAYGLYSFVLLAILLAMHKETTLKNALYSSTVAFSSVIVGFMVVSIPLLSLVDALSVINLEWRRGGTHLVLPKDLALFLNPYLYNMPRVEKTLYVGHLALALSLMSVFLLRSRIIAEKNKVLILFGLIMLLCSSVVAFGLLSHKLIRLIPAIGNHPWNRLVVIVGLAIAILAAVALDYLVCRAKLLKNNALKMAVVSVLLVGAVYQIYDQSVLFRKFNATADRDDFFPVTPAITYLIDNLKSTQSVVADDAFLYSGSLGSYKIPEWFAHGYKTDAEKDVLSRIVSDPFPSPTSARFRAENIRFESKLFSKLGIRYVLTEAKWGKVIRIQPEGQHVAAPAMPENSLSQIIRLDEPVSISAVGFVLATYDAKHAPADVFLELIGQNGDLLAKAFLEAKAVRNNQRARFEFERNIELMPGTYELRIGLTKKEVNGHLTAWYTRNPKYQYDAIKINGEPLQGAMLYSVFGANEISSEKSRWRFHKEIDKNVLIAENLDAPKGAYFIQSLDPDLDWTEKNIHTERLSAESVAIRYEGEEAGYVVLPIRWFPGWVAYRNGIKTVPESYLGMLLALKVDGPSKIEFSYEPTYLGLGLSLTFIGVFCLLFLIYIVDIKKMSVCVATEEKK